MAYYIGTKSYCEHNGHHTPPSGMTEVDNETYLTHVDQVRFDIESDRQSAATQKAKARDILIDSLVVSTGLTEEEVRLAF